MVPKYLLPQELAKPPIEEALFEVRFQPAQAGEAGRLPALLRDALGEEYPRSEAIVHASHPDWSRAAQPDLRYQPKLLLTGDGAFVLVGDAAVTLRLVGPYPGWDAVRARIGALLDVLQASKLLGPIERISLKFVNILRDPPARQLDALRIDFSVNGDAVPETGLHVRMELSDERYERIVDLQPGRTGPVIEAHRDAHGLLLALECRRSLAGEDFWSQRTDLLENLHFELRALFFRLLTRAAVEKLGPIYRAAPESG
jgi:uncharacterized protein (TIGR04255 family)